MFFRNLYLYRFSDAVAASFCAVVDTDDGTPALEANLADKRLRPCGPLEQSTRGFVSPMGRHHEPLMHEVNSYALVAVGGEDKILPGRVVNEALAERIAAIVEREQRRVGAKERKRLKDEVLTDLLPRAFVDHRRTFAYLDLRGGWLVVDHASSSVAEEVLEQLRDAAGTFPVAPMSPEESPRILMTDWASHGKLPAGLALGDEIELRDPSEGGAVVRCRRQDLETDEVREHLRTGKQVFQLALTFDDRISFVLGADLVVRKLKFLEQVLEELGEVETDSAVAELDSRFALMTLEVSRLLEKLDEWFGLPRPTDR
jgi:recombination associated protein RdgC